MQSASKVLLVGLLLVSSPAFVVSHAGNMEREAPTPTLPGQAKAATQNKRLTRRIQMIQNHYPDDWPFLSHCLRPEEPKGILNYDLRQCAEGEKPLFTKSSRIAVVGAGPAGISMTKLLSERGFSDITVFEKEARVGGKSKQFVTESGEKMDTGTIWVAGKYECLELWADQVGMKELPVGPRLVSSNDTVLANMEAPYFGRSGTWAADYAFRKYNVDPTVFEDQVAFDVKRYIQLWTQTMDSPDYMFPDESTVDFTMINQSFLAWLEERELYTLIPQLFITTSAQGYGSLRTIPAYYGLMWNHPNLFGGTGGQSGLFEDWQTMWERILQATGAKVHLGANISWIKRGPRFRLPFDRSLLPSRLLDLLHRWFGDPVEIAYKSNDNSQQQRETFDFVVMAAPMPHALDLLHKPTDNELDLFSAYNYKSVRYSLGHLKDLGVLDSSSSDFDLFSWIDRADQQTDYHVTRRSQSRLDRTVERSSFARDGVDSPITLARSGKLKGMDTKSVTLFSIAPFDTSAEATSKLAASDLDTYGINVDFFHTQIWEDYFPWKNLTQIVEDRTPWRIWDNQGKERTWFTGSYTSFESVADILDYNLKMINELLCE